VLDSFDTTTIFVAEYFPADPGCRSNGAARRSSGTFRVLIVDAEGGRR